ncbi:MAG: response regulator [Desulfoferrobacter sp.]
MKRVMVVDNHPVILTFMRDLLNGAGHEVLTAEDGLSALDLLQTCIPDVIFIDLIMPNIDGKKLCKIIRRRPDFDGVCLVILSGLAAADQVDYAELGAEACIAKGAFNEMGEEVLRVLETGAPGTYQRQCNESDGEPFWPRVISDELLAINRHFEEILASIAEGIIELSHEGRIVYCNPTTRAIVGIPEEELLGSWFYELFAQNDQKRVKSMLERMDNDEQVVAEDSLLTINEKQVSVNFLPIVGEEQGAILIVSDITDKKRMEQQLRQAQKMEAIGLLARGIAHDFNNILTAIVGNVSLAKMYLKTDDKAYGKLVEAEKASMRARNLTLQLLTFSRGGAPLKKTVSLPEILKECCKNTLKNPAVRCEIEVDENLWPVDIDEGQITHAIQNLVVNAEDSMAKGGLILISANNHVIADKCGLPVRAGNYVELIVADQGVGIPEDQLSKIFDPYFSTKTKGSGLGLTLAYSIIKNHKGCIRVKSEPKKGTTFYVYLPASMSELRKQAAPKSVTVVKGKVLVMDDEKIVREVVGEMLEVLGYKVEFAEEGEAAIHCYKKAMASARDFDAVIMDLTVPDGLGTPQA